MEYIHKFLLWKKSAIWTKSYTDCGILNGKRINGWLRKKHHSLLSGLRHHKLPEQLQCNFAWIIQEHWWSLKSQSKISQMSLVKIWWLWRPQVMIHIIYFNYSVTLLALYGSVCIYCVSPSIYLPISVSKLICTHYMRQKYNCMSMSQCNLSNQTWGHLIIIKTLWELLYSRADKLLKDIRTSQTCREIVVVSFNLFKCK